MVRSSLAHVLPVTSRARQLRTALGSVFKKEPHRSVVDLVVVFDLVVDGAVDMSATFVIHVEDSTVIIFVSIATTASKSSIPRS